MNVCKMLQELSDKDYASFQAKLCPTIKSDSVIGVRVPKIRTLAKQLLKTNDYKEFLQQLPHSYYEENMLHSVIISHITDIGECYDCLEKFLPYIDNWAVCDTCNPKILTKDKMMLIDKINMWIKSKHTYTIRFGVEMLMRYFLDDNYQKSYLEIPLKIESDEYYVNMMLAWFYATALAKQWGDAFDIVKHNKLPKWVHNKTIQKAIESFRITNQQKSELKTLKVD